jgi:hypothetical protein
MSVWSNDKFLVGAELKRQERKTKGETIQTFDCFNAMCKGEKVYCRKGIDLSNSLDKTLPLIMVLRGRTAAVCKNCTEASI